MRITKNNFFNIKPDRGITMDEDKVPAVEYEGISTAANAIQLGVNIIHGVAGNDMADGIGGENMSPKTISRILAAKLNSYIKE